MKIIGLALISAGILGCLAYAIRKHGELGDRWYFFMAGYASCLATIYVGELPW